VPVSKSHYLIKQSISIVKSLAASTFIKQPISLVLLEGSTVQEPLSKLFS